MEETTATGPGITVEQPSLEVLIGLKIRARRRALEMTAADLANRASISVATVSKVESGSISASLSTLQALARALTLPMVDLFDQEEVRGDCSYVPPGNGLRLDRRGTKAGHLYDLLGHSLRGPLIVEPYMITLRDDAERYSTFRHDGIEFIHMLEGEVEYRHGDSLYHLEPGASLMFDSTVRHGPERLIRHPIRYLTVIVSQREHP